MYVWMTIYTTNLGSACISYIPTMMYYIKGLMYYATALLLGKVPHIPYKGTYNMWFTDWSGLERSLSINKRCTYIIIMFIDCIV